MQVLLTTLLVKLAVMAAAATIVVRFRRFRQFLIFEHRPWPDRVMFALMLQDLGATQDARDSWARLALEREDLPELAAFAK